MDNAVIALSFTKGACADCYNYSEATPSCISSFDLQLAEGYSVMADAHAHYAEKAFGAASEVVPEQ